MATDNPFGNDLGFWAGRGMGEVDGQRRATNRAIEVIETINENNARERNRDMMVKRNIMMDKIQRQRANNLRAMAEYEYDVRVKYDVGKRIRAAGEKLSDYAKSGTAQSEDLQLLSDSLMGAREIHWLRDRDEWIDARFDELIENVKFPTNDIEAIAAGGYAMPKIETIPPYLEADREALVEKRRDWAEVARVLTDPEDAPLILPRLERGGMKLT